MPTLPGMTIGRTWTPKTPGVKQAARDQVWKDWVLVSGDDSYDGANTGYAKIVRASCFLAKHPTSGVCAPVKRTRANGSGSASTALTVDNATHFKAGDSIVVGYQTAQAIVSINYSTNVITLTSTATWLDNDPVYVDNYKTAFCAFTEDEVKLYEDETPSTYVNRSVQGYFDFYGDQDAFYGDIDAILSDPLSAWNLRKIVLDDYLFAVDAEPRPGGYNRATPWRQVFLSGNKTLVAGDSGTEFICNAAAVITLPSLATAGDGFRIRARQIADADLTITAPAGKLIALHNAAATSVAYSTSSQKIGAGVEISLLPDFTKYIAANMSAGVQAVTVS